MSFLHPLPAGRTQFGHGLALTSLLALGCGTGAPTEPAPQAGSMTPRSDVQFVDVAREAGVVLVSACGDLRKNHLLESTGSGVAVADYDDDGDDDIYVATAQTTADWLAGRRPRANALYRNDGHGAFADVAEAAGVALRAWSAGVYFADYDNDGDKDLFVTTWGPDVLYRNDGDGTFTDVTEQAGVAGAADAWGAGAAFGDLDADGDLDLYVTNYCEYDLEHPPFGGNRTQWKGIAVYPGPVGFRGQSDVLYRNEGDGTFANVTQASGVDDSTRPLYGLGVVMSDLDDDRDLDIYVANDSCPNYLWRNDGGWRFSEIAAIAGVATNEDAKEQAGMGVDAGDIDGDGRMDLVVTNFSHDWSTLYRNTGDLRFVDHTFVGGFQDTYLPLSWGVKMFDYDNDGWLDVFIANGHIYPEVDDHPHLNTTYRQANQLFRNRGQGVFDNVSDSAGPGLEIVEGSRGLAVSDVDRDGDLDVVLTRLDGPPAVLRNEGGNRRSWASISLIGTRSNRDGVGARLILESGDRRQVREVNPFGSYESQSSYAVHFGLGDRERIDRVVIRWPSGLEEQHVDLPVRSFLTLEEGKGVPVESTP